MRKYTLVAAFLIALGALGWFTNRPAVPEAKEATDWLPWLGLAFDVMGKVDWLNVLLISGGFVVLVMLMVWQFTPGDGFDMRSMFASRAVGPSGAERWTVDPGRVFQTGAFCFTSWALVWVVTHDKLTEIFLFVYVGLWAGTRAVNQIIASKFPVAPGTALPEQPQQAGTVNIDITQGTKP